MASINPTEMELTECDLQSWIDTGNFELDNNLNLGNKYLPDNLTQGDAIEHGPVQTQDLFQTQSVTNWPSLDNFTDTTSGQSLDSDIISPFSALSTPTSKDSLLVSNNEQAANNVSNHDKAIVDTGANNELSQNIVIGHTPTLTSVPPLSDLNTQLSAQNTAQPGLFWAGNFAPINPQSNHMMNNNNNNNNQFMPSSTMVPAPWLMNHTMHQPQSTMPQAAMMQTNIPYHSHFGSHVVQGVPLNMYAEVSGNMNQQLFPGPVNPPITDASGRLPKRRVPGQEATPRRVSPTTQRSASAKASSSAKTKSNRGSGSFLTPSEWEATRTYDKPKDLSARYQSLDKTKSVPAYQMAPIDRLAVHDYALRTAFAKGARRAQEILTEALCEDIGTQKLFGCNLQWPTPYNRACIEQCVESYLQDKVKFAVDDDPATAAGMIRDSCLSVHPGLFPTSKDCSTSSSAQGRNKERRAQSTNEKAKEQSSTAKPKARPQGKTQTAEKKGKVTKSSSETDKFFLNGDGHFRILRSEKLEAALQRTVEKHEKEGTSFQLSEPQDAPLPSATVGKKRKASKASGAEPATKKSTPMVSPQLAGPIAESVGTTDAVLPTVRPKPFSSQLILPGMDNAVTEDTSTAATNVIEATNAVTSVTDIVESKAEYESRRINELTRIDCGLPEAVILDFMYPKETSPYEVVRKAAKEGLQDQSELLKNPACRMQVLKIFDDNHRALLNVEMDSRPEWDARARNKEKRDRKKAAQTEELKAARAARDAIAPTEVVTQEENDYSAELDAELEALFEEGPEFADTCDIASS